MKRSIVMLPVLLAVAACGGQPSDEARKLDLPDAGQPSATAADSASEAAGEPPQISANAAPGVAFDYSYNFALPEDAISKVQSRHAAQCESIGIARCRVTGMTFDRDDSGAVAATLAFRLDPALAHGFARDATDIVEAADGRLADSRIAGEDVGSQIVPADKTLTGIDAELARIDVQLRIPGLSKEVRGRLVEQAQTLRAQRRDLQTERGGKVESLATTPVSFAYAASDGVLGLDDRSPFNRAARASSASFMAMVEVVLTLGGALAPWALLGGAIFWTVRRLRARPLASVE